MAPTRAGAAAGGRAGADRRDCVAGGAPLSVGVRTHVSGGPYAGYEPPLTVTSITLVGGSAAKHCLRESVQAVKRAR